MDTTAAAHARTEAATRWRHTPKPTTPAGWLARAREVAIILALDAVARDAASQPPHAEVQLLKDAGLVTLLGPREHGGGGATWATSYGVTAAVARADGSVAHLLGNHYSWFWSAQILGTAAQTGGWARAFTERGWYLGGAVNPRDGDMVAREEAGGLVFSGEKFFSTGGVVSDVTVLEGVLQDGEGTHVFAFVETTHPGISFKGDWDVIGQRLTVRTTAFLHMLRGTSPC